MRLRNVRARVLVACAVFAAVGVATPSAGAGVGGVGIFASNSRPYSISYNQWAVKWNRWAFGTPRPTNPLVDPTDCDRARQPVAGVTFLPVAVGATGEVTIECTVPEGNAVLLTPMGMICAAAIGDPPGRLRACARRIFAWVQSIEVTIEGESVPNINRFRKVSGRFALNLPRNDFFGVNARRTPAAVAGWFLMLRPLAEGTYEIETRTTLKPPGQPVVEVIFRYDITV
jgi:hypothetical protein